MKNDKKRNLVKISVYIQPEVKEEIKRRMEIKTNIKHSLSSYIRYAVKLKLFMNKNRVRLMNEQYHNNKGYREKERLRKKIEYARKQTRK
jgi:Arc/MetJ-type ribon-helix-helix transcriptional regulator